MRRKRPCSAFVLDPNERNGLRAPRRLMADKLTTVPRTKVGARVGRLDDEDFLRLNRAILVFLGLAAPLQGRRGSRAEPKLGP